jgi:hypothetical protein
MTPQAFAGTDLPFALIVLASAGPDQYKTP